MPFFYPCPRQAASPCSRRHKLCIAHFRAKHEKLAHAVVPPLPKKSADFSGSPCGHRTVISHLDYYSIFKVQLRRSFTCSHWKEQNYRVFLKNFLFYKRSLHSFGIGVSKRNLFQRKIFEKEQKNLPAGSGEQGILAFLLFEYQRKNF